MKKVLKFLLPFSIVLLIVIARAQLQRGRMRPEAAMAVPVQAQGSSPAAAPAGLGVRTQRGPAAVQEHARVFRETYGMHLQAEFSQKGHLISMRGSPGQGTKADDFRSDDPQKAIARAREILRAAQELLGIEERAPLENPTYQGNAVSAQVSFRETYQGAQTAPFGSVSVDLGSGGELIGLDSSYLTGIEATNTVSLTQDQAKSQITASLGSEMGSGKVNDGTPVLWVSSPLESGGVKGRHAYEFFVRGHQIVVDASSGTILSRKDRRNF